MQNKTKTKPAIFDTIRVKIASHRLGSPENRGFHKSWDYNPPYLAIYHYSLGHESSLLRPP